MPNELTAVSSRDAQDAEMSEMIDVRDLTFGYSGAPPVFLGFQWQVCQGETWAVLGPSGCGKTTLLYLLAGLRQPQAGKVLVGGQEVLRPRPHTGLILQDYGLLPWATVKENAQLGLRIRDFYGPDGKHAPLEYQSRLVSHAVSRWLEALGLAKVADSYPAQISGGQRQRTAIARTLALEPDLLLMDEPFSSVDAPTREDLQNLTLRLCREGGITLTIVTHSIEEAAYLGRKILLLGHPPNREAVIIDNPGAGRPEYRDQDPYQALCRELRDRMAML